MSKTASTPRQAPDGWRQLVLQPWRTIDLVTAALIGVTFGVAYWGWSTAYTTLTEPVVTSGVTQPQQ